MLGPTGLIKEKEKKRIESWKWFGHSFDDVCVYTIVISGVVYSGIKLMTTASKLGRRGIAGQGFTHFCTTTL